MCVQRFLAKDGISIPQKYTSFLAPVTTAKLWNSVHAFDDLEHFETSYVVKVAIRELFVRRILARQRLLTCVLGAYLMIIPVHDCMDVDPHCMPACRRRAGESTPNQPPTLNLTVPCGCD